MSGNNGCPNDENDYEVGVRVERARVLAIIDAAWKSPKLKGGTRLAIAILARRVRNQDDRSEVADEKATPVPSEEPQAFLAWCYEVAPGETALLTRAEVDRRRLPAPDEALGLVRDLLGLEFAWPLADVLDKLRDAALHLLQDHACDGHGYERINAALDRLPMYRATVDKAARWMAR